MTKIQKIRNNSFHNLNGENKNQLLITVDTRGNKTGTATREACHLGSGIPHLAFVAFVIDKDENLVLTRRSRQKSLWSGYWDGSVVSHVLPGETVEEAANRRGKEELGIAIPFKTIGAYYYFVKHGGSAENEYCFVLIGKTNKDIHPNPLEFEKVLKVTFADLRKDIKKGKEKYTPWLLLSLGKIDLIPWL